MAVPRPAETRPSISLPQELGLREGHVEVDGGINLHYVEAGHGPPVVLLHGFPEFWYSWRRQLPALASAGYRAIAIDMRGFGQSDKPREVEAYLLPTLGRDIARAIETLGADRASVVGHDFGALVAWQVAMHHPDVVERLVIINVPHPERGRASLRSPRQLRRSWYIGFFQIPVLAEAYVRWGDHQFIRRALRAGSTGNGPEDVERYVDAFAIPGVARSGLNYYRALFRLFVRGAPEIRRIDAPVMVMWGEQDPYLGSEWAEPLRRWVPDVRMECLPDVGHWPQIDQPDRVNSMLLDFLQASQTVGP